MSVTSVRIDDELELLLDKTAHTLDRPKGWVINQALREFFTRHELEKQRWEDTLEALEDIRMGRVVDGNKVHAWLDSWGTENVLRAPKE